MNVNIITMDRDEAQRKFEACVREKHADSYEYARQCAVAYEHLAAGKKLISLSKSIRQAGFNAEGLPNVAIARSDRREVRFTWERYETLARYSCELQPNWSGKVRFESLNRIVDLEQRPPKNEWLSGYALVPAVPADVRPKTGQLSQWFTLWEVDHWYKKPQHMTAPRDPLLLEHIGGELYAVLAQWDLTPIEQAILEGAL